MQKLLAGQRVISAKKTDVLEEIKKFYRIYVVGRKKVD